MIPEPFIYEHLFWRRQNVQVNVIKCLHLQVTYLPSGLAGTFSGLSVTSGPILTFTIRIAVVFRWASLAAILTATKIKTLFSYLTQKNYDKHMFNKLFIFRNFLTWISTENMSKRKYKFCGLCNLQVHVSQKTSKSLSFITI